MELAIQIYCSIGIFSFLTILALMMRDFFKYTKDFLNGVPMDDNADVYFWIYNSNLESWGYMLMMFFVSVFLMFLIGGVVWPFYGCLAMGELIDNIRQRNLKEYK